jgi:soluble lytic murein transglycosylase-like protein
MAIVEAESKGDPNAISPKDCRGLAQLNIYTARIYNPFLIRMDLHNPEINLEVAAQHIRDLSRLVKSKFPTAALYQRIILIAAAYNAGWSVVERTVGVPAYPETKRYASEVLRNYLNLQERLD